MHTWNSSIQKVEADEWRIQGQPAPDLKKVSTYWTIYGPLKLHKTNGFKGVNIH